LKSQEKVGLWKEIKKTHLNVWFDLG
jgi:hypothetical protein